MDHTNKHGDSKLLRECTLPPRQGRRGPHHHKTLACLMLLMAASKYGMR
jgi:acyl CoA:acetate/3-ketoacid CoA transferase beta subunit